jgi:hypothetical protein
MKTRLFIVAGLIALVALLGVTGCSAADLKAFEGILQNADSLSGNVTVTLDNGEIVTFNLADIDLKDILAASDNVGLEAGDHIKVRLHDNGEVEDVEFKNTHIEGVIKDISGNSTITITTEENKDVTLTIDAKTLVVVHATGRATMADLEVGQQVYARYDTATMVAEKICAGNDGPAWQNRENKQENDHGNGQGQGQHQEKYTENNKHSDGVQKGKAGHGK